VFVVSLIAAALAALPGAAFAAVDLYETVNRVRAGEGRCLVAQKSPPLMRQPALERAARALAGGQPLRDAIMESGYRATAWRSIVITGTHAGAAAVLERKFCEQLLEDRMTDIGIHREAGRAWIVMAAPFAPQVALSLEGAAQRVLELVNDARTQPRRCGGKPFNAAPPLTRSAVLGKVALLHAQDMARHDNFSHTGHDGSTPADRVRRSGYRFRTTAENIAAGPSTPEAVVAEWIRSPGHCANLMNSAYSEIGIAFAIERNSRFGVYWAQVFAAPR
jgi:uncharacterized protein YkwD